MGFNIGGGLSGGLSGAAAGSVIPGFGPIAGGVIGAAAGLFGGGSSAKDAAKAQNKYYARYVLPKLEEQQQRQSFLNNQALGTYSSVGNESARLLGSLGSGNFGLSEQEGGRLGELQGLQQELQRQMQFGSPNDKLQAQSQLQELDSLMRGQAQGEQFGGQGGLGNFLGDHALTQAQNNIYNDQINSQYSAAFGGQAPSSFLGKAKGLAGSQSILDTYGRVTDVLGQSAQLGLGGIQTGVNANTNLANTTQTATANFGVNNALGSAQAGEGGYGQQVLGALGQAGQAFDPLNQGIRQSIFDFLDRQNGGINAPNAGPQQQGFLGGLFG